MALIKLVGKTFMVCRKSTNTIKVFSTQLLSLWYIYIYLLYLLEKNKFQIHRSGVIFTGNHNVSCL